MNIKEKRRNYEKPAMQVFELRQQPQRWQVVDWTIPRIIHQEQILSLNNHSVEPQRTMTMKVSL